MKKNWPLIITSTIIYIVIIILLGIYLIKPGINKLKEGSEIKEITYDEKTKLIDEINKKYIDLENDIVSKYNPNIETINTKYDNLETSIKEKYSNLENTIKANYDKKEKELNNSINNNKVLQNKEFFANGLSKKYYELSDIGMELNKEKGELNSKEREEIRENESLRDKEIRKNEEDKKRELDTIKNNKENEINRLKERKTNELDAINNQKINKKAIQKEGISKILLAVIIMLIPVIYIVSTYNKLTHLSNLVEEKWSQIDVLLKKRTDLIPNIVETVKGYAKHEKDTLSEITKARNQVIKATTKEEEIETNQNLSNVISKLLFLQENYPELKANENFLDLQSNLKEIENDIAIYRQQYNKTVLKYKNKLEMFPSNIVAGIFNFKDELFYEIDKEEKENVKIKL